MLILFQLMVSLILTLLFESLLALMWGVRARQDWLLLALVNVLTNPMVVSLHRLWGGGLWVTAALEAGAVLAEALAYRRWGRDTRPALLFSLCANCFSYFSGVILNYIAGRFA